MGEIVEKLLSTWYGVLIFIIIDAALLTVIVAVNYRWFFKRFSDLLISLFLIIITSPLLLGCYIAEKIHIKNTLEYGSVTQREYFIGKNGKIIALNEFSYRDKDGNVSAFGEKIRPFKGLPLLFDVFLGKISFIGALKTPLFEERFISDEDYLRFKVRPGLINHLVVRGENNTRSYEKMFRADRIYVKKHGLFGDMGIFFTWLFYKIRGERKNLLGEPQNIGYSQYLLREGRITLEEYEAALSEVNELMEKE